jgi:catechol 2,3-dioxygenase-like lactoylglutathione lyase family enzyme
MPGPNVPRFDIVTMDCPDPHALARFYGALLEWPVPDSDRDFVAIDPPGGGTALTFQRALVFTAPTWPDPAVPEQMHVDLAVDDLEAARERAIALGARHLDTQDKFRVYADPVGQLFCLCTW